MQCRKLFWSRKVPCPGPCNLLFSLLASSPGFQAGSFPALAGWQELEPGTFCIVSSCFITELWPHTRKGNPNFFCIPKTNLNHIYWAAFFPFHISAIICHNPYFCLNGRWSRIMPQNLSLLTKQHINPLAGSFVFKRSSHIFLVWRCSRQLIQVLYHVSYTTWKVQIRKNGLVANWISHQYFAIFLGYHKIIVRCAPPLNGPQSVNFTLKNGIEILFDSTHTPYCTSIVLFDWYIHPIVGHYGLDQWTRRLY